MSDKILEAMGAANEQDALRFVAEINSFTEDLAKATGREKLGAIRAETLKTIEAMQAIAKTLDVPLAQILGVILALKADAEKLPETQKQLAEASKAAEEATRTELVRQARDKHIVNAETEKAPWFQSLTIEQLRGFVATAAPIIPTQVKVQVAPGAGGGPAREITVAATADGKKYEDLRPAQRVALQNSDHALYDVMRADWESRGKPEPLLVSQFYRDPRKQVETAPAATTKH